ncbi:MAG TPA: HAMP domain-containing sensor histidine kinase, partial [Gemmatimonadaceae bacterium]|nr:HAMP domain-containing sensor histidine kinase [Gemmatimonadaceae bacterium]
TASMAALWIAFRLRLDDTLLGRWRRAGSAVVMGLAIAGMHYTAMSAARFAPRSVPAAIFAQTIPAGAPLATAVIGGTLIVLMLALVGATVDRRTVAHARSIHEREMALAHERIARAEAETARHVAETANASKSQFLAVMSHELRTPLNAISGYVDLLSLGVDGGLSEKQQVSLTRIQLNQQHLLSLIDDVLSFAKIEAGSLNIDVRSVPVHQVIEMLEVLVRPEIERKDLVFSCEPCDDTLSVRADPKQLRQILLNFLANAIKFTPDGGRILVGAEPNEEFVRIWVSDTGIGIPGDMISHVFEPFFQVEQGNTRRYPGIGLGLAIARDLASAMNGEVRLESTAGKGTTISLQLPAG